MAAVYQAAADELLRRSGCTIRKYRDNLTGLAYTWDSDWGIETPPPTTPKRFAVFAHEIGHQMLHRGHNRPRWQEEAEAWDYALARFAEFGLDGHDQAMELAVKSMNKSIWKALRRGANHDLIMAGAPTWWRKTRVLRAEWEKKYLAKEKA